MKGLEVALEAQVGTLDLALSFSVQGDPLVVVGPNGSGKTSLLRMIVGAGTPTKGRLTLGDRALFDSSSGIDLRPADRRIGYLPQGYALFPHLTALANVAFPIAQLRPRRPAPERAARTQALLQTLGIAAAADRFPAALSGGEQQRVAMARALATDPQALLLDEPLAALDVGARREVREFLAQRLRAWNLPAVVVTHDVADALALGGEVLVLERGRILQRGRVADLARAPASSFVEEFVAGWNRPR